MRGRRVGLRERGERTLPASSVSESASASAFFSRLVVAASVWYFSRSLSASARSLNWTNAVPRKSCVSL